MNHPKSMFQLSGVHCTRYLDSFGWGLLADRVRRWGQGSLGLGIRVSGLGFGVSDPRPGTLIPKPLQLNPKP